MQYSMAPAVMMVSKVVFGQLKLLFLLLLWVCLFCNLLLFRCLIWVVKCDRKVINLTNQIRCSLCRIWPSRFYSVSSP